MTTEFSNQISRSNARFELLPLFHTCDAFDARKHIRSYEIKTNDVCEVFEEKITYLFYGRPAFKYITSGESVRDLSLYPIAFVLSTPSITPLKRIYPFDSGAMYHDRYKSYFNPKMTLFDFEIEPDTSRIKDLILHFYKSNSNYRKFNVGNHQNQAFDFEAFCYAEMIRALSASPADERRATIEIQADEIVKMNADNLLGIIVPAGLRDDRTILNFAEINEARIISYNVAVWNPGQCFGLIQDAADRLLDLLGA